MLKFLLTAALAAGFQPAVHKPVVLKGVTATVFTDRTVSRNGRINPYKLAGCALPVYWMVGEKVTVRAHDTGRIVELPIVDTGPWSTDDCGILRGERPMAERGESDQEKYDFRAGNRAGIDLTPAAVKRLGLPEDEGTFTVDITLFGDEEDAHAE